MNESPVISWNYYLTGHGRWRQRWTRTVFREGSKVGERPPVRPKTNRYRCPVRLVTEYRRGEGPFGVPGPMLSHPLLILLLTREIGSLYLEHYLSLDFCQCK